MQVVDVEESTGLHFVKNDEAGFARVKKGTGFAYYDQEGNLIEDVETLERIKDLAIPPIWKSVWICDSPKGYLQATGIDLKNRKQYLYHETWIEHQQNNKFSKIKEFGYALPDIRKKVEENLDLPGWPREKVIALVLEILDRTHIRIGNQAYFKKNQTHGITTLRRKHLHTNGDELILKYKAKSKKYRKVALQSSKLRNLVKSCSELQGYEIFTYQDEGKKTVPVRSRDVNDYLKEITLEDFTSKNYRTWGGTVAAVENFDIAKAKANQNKRRKLRTAIIREVADKLQNTMAVCEKYYIHPKVLSALTIDFEKKKIRQEVYPDGLKAEEKVVLGIIEENYR